MSILLYLIIDQLKLHMRLKLLKRQGQASTLGDLTADIVSYCEREISLYDQRDELVQEVATSLNREIAGMWRVKREE